MNVTFPYLYRDAGNWKKFGAAIFANPDNLSVAEAHARIRAVWQHPCADLNWFVPEHVGLELLREGWERDLDGPWHEVGDELCVTEDRPTDRRTLREFVLEFEHAASAGWLKTSEVSA